MTFPNEIYGEILKYLPAGSESLALCARTCRTIYPIAQRLYFRHTKLTCCVAPRSCLYTEMCTPARLLDLITDRPHIADYISTLEVQIASGHSCVAGLDAQALGSVLLQLPNLSELLFPLFIAEFEHYWKRGAITWTRSDPDFKAILLKTCGLGSLRVLDVSNLERFPVDMIDRSVPLKQLVLGKVAISQIPEPLNPLQLNTLSLTESDSHGDNFLMKHDWLVQKDCRIDKASVEHLQIHFRLPSRTWETHLGGPTVTKIFNLFPNVQHLDFSPNPDDLSFYRFKNGECSRSGMIPSYHGPDLCSLPSLRNLTFRGDFYTTRIQVGRDGRPVTFGSCLHLVTGLLKTLSSTNLNHIENITLVIGVKVSGLRPLLYDYLDHLPALPGWEELVDTMISARLPSLKQVEFVIYAEEFVTGKKKSELLNLLLNQPYILRLKSKGLLR